MEITIIVALTVIGTLLLGVSELFSAQLVDAIRETAKTTIRLILDFIFRATLVFGVLSLATQMILLSIPTQSLTLEQAFSNPHIMIRVLLIAGVISAFNNMRKFSMPRKIIKTFASVNAKYISAWLGFSCVVIAAVLGLT